MYANKTASERVNGTQAVAQQLCWWDTEEIPSCVRFITLKNSFPINVVFISIFSIKTKALIGFVVYGSEVPYEHPSTENLYKLFRKLCNFENNE